MILPDVNVLVYAFDSDASQHGRYRAWLDAALRAPEDVALIDTVLSGFVRIATHPKIVPTPAPAAVAIDFVQGLIDAPNARWLRGSAAIWRTFGGLVGGDAGIRANLVPDAFIAAAALAHGARVATADRGFARYGVEFFDPGVAASP